MGIRPRSGGRGGGLSSAGGRRSRVARGGRRDRRPPRHGQPRHRPQRRFRRIRRQAAARRRRAPARTPAPSRPIVPRAFARRNQPPAHLRAVVRYKSRTRTPKRQVHGRRNLYASPIRIRRIAGRRQNRIPSRRPRNRTRRRRGHSFGRNGTRLCPSAWNGNAHHPARGQGDDRRIRQDSDGHIPRHRLARAGDAGRQDTIQRRIGRRRARGAA